MEENNLIDPSPLSESSDSGLMSIENLIHLVRGQQVMLDSDLALLYGVETKALNQAVKRNLDRFPEDFMFQLTKDEAEYLRSQNAISNSRSQSVTLKDGSRLQKATLKQGHNIKYLPHAFTENGVAMLSSVLRSKTAIEVNIRIMRAFTAMRGFLMSNARIFQRLETLEHHQLLLQQHQNNTDRRIEEVLTRLDYKEAEPIEGFFYEGQIFDAYALISDLVRKASHRVILIDNFVDDRVLKTLDKRKEGVTALIYTHPKKSQIELDIKKYNAQYPEISLCHCTNVHDRFLIVDDTVYFIGGSIKDLGKRIVAISEMHRSPQDIISRLK